MCFEPPGEERVLRAFGGALSTCARLGVPIAAHKTEGPAHVITFLGIEVDTVAQEVRLPMEKLMRLQREIRSWSSRKSCTKRELVFGRPATARMLCGKARSHLPEMDNFFVDNTKGVASQSAIERGFSLRPDVVERIPGVMEWQKHDVWDY